MTHVETEREEVARARAAVNDMAQAQDALRFAFMHAHIEHCHTGCPVEGRAIDDRCRCGLTVALRSLGMS